MVTLCSSTGEIKLLNSELHLIATRKYFNRGHRKGVLKHWANLYGEKFQSMVIQIAPNIDPFRDEKLMEKIKRNNKKNVRKL